METTYNGWTNRETWNVARWIQHDEGMYHLAQDGYNGYADFITSNLEFMNPATPDGISWTHPDLCISELDDLLNEIQED